MTFSPSIQVDNILLCKGDESLPQESIAQKEHSTFQGNPCRKHKSVTRSVETGRCVKCQAERPAAISMLEESLSEHIPKVIKIKRPKRTPEEKKEYERRRNWHRQNIPTPLYPAPAACENCARKQKASLHVDHDHHTGKFRGWLCGQCNRSIGGLGDNIAGLVSALSYLVKAQ